MTITLPEMVVLEGGRTWIGSSPNDKFANAGEPLGGWCEVAGPFEIGKFPVTVAEWQSFEPGRFEEVDGELPAHGISWDDAMSFIRWLSKESEDESWDLPSALEWEHAARAGTDSVFPDSDTLSPTEANFLFDESIQRIGPGSITKTGSYPGNEFGIYDLLGNVSEWTNEAGRLAGSHQIRGGAWDYLPRLLRCSWSDEISDTSERDNVGFRLARRPGITQKLG